MIKKITYFVDYFPSRSETWINNEVLQLLKMGYIVKIFSMKKKPSEVSNKNSVLVSHTEYLNKYVIINFYKYLVKYYKSVYIIIKRIWEDFLYDTQGLRGKIQVIRDLLLYIYSLERINNFNPDIVIVHFAASRANFSLFNKIINNTPYIIKIHAGDVFRRTNLFQLKTKLAFKILSISKYNIDFIEKRDSDIDLTKFIIHHCGVPIDEYKFVPMLNRNNKVPSILSVGRLVPMKGFDTLIKASSLLSNKNIMHKLIIAGYGPYKEFLIDLVHKLGVQKNIEFMDYRSPEEIKNLLYSSSLFVLASKFDKKLRTQDGIPVALMEAMSSGLPVIGTKISGIPELVDDRFNGILAEPDDPVDLAYKIEEILKMSKNQLEEMTQKARTKIEEHFNIITLTSSLKNLLETVN